MQLSMLVYTGQLGSLGDMGRLYWSFAKSRKGRRHRRGQASGHWCQSGRRNSLNGNGLQCRCEAPLKWYT